ncbi:MAG: hypothetical protein GTN36_04560 [Candidatus Aenigmarchaeota archaeon]|nr:hypothetical protein [Candidatus Aenigmarchaeota archaeon]
MKKIYWLVIVLIVLGITLFIWISGSSFTSGYIPKKGEFFDTYAKSVYDLKRPGTTSVNGVEITLEDMTSNQPVQTSITKTIIYSEEYPEDKDDGIAEFKIIVGNTYKITANFNDSTNSTICTFGTIVDERGDSRFIGTIHVIVSKEDTIGPIVCSFVGFI